MAKIAKLISVSEESGSRRSGLDRRKNWWFALMTYIQMVFFNIKYIHIKSYIYCKYIHSSPVITLNCDCVLVCCGNCKKIKHLKKRFKNYHQKGQLYFIYLNIYQSAQIMVSAPSMIVRHV